MAVLVLDDGDAASWLCETHTIEVVVAFHLIGEGITLQIVNACQGLVTVIEETEPIDDEQVVLRFQWHFDTDGDDSGTDKVSLQ